MVEPAHALGFTDAAPVDRLAEEVDLLRRRVSAMAHELERIRSAGSHGLRPGPDILVRFFGEFAVTSRDRLVDGWTARRSRIVFQYMVQRHPRAVHRDQLIEAVWPEIRPESGRRSLNQAIHGARLRFRAVGIEDPIESVGEVYRIRRHLSLWTDVGAFEQAARRALNRLDLDDETRMHDAALALDFYRGDYLAAEPYEPWAEPIRRYLFKMFCDLLERQGRWLLAAGHNLEAIAVSRRLIEAEPIQESAHRRLMIALAREGRRAEAVEAYRRCRQILTREVGLAPSPLTQRTFGVIEEGGLF